MSLLKMTKRETSEVRKGKAKEETYVRIRYSKSTERIVEVEGSCAAPLEALWYPYSVNSLFAR